MRIHDILTCEVLLQLVDLFDPLQQNWTKHFILFHIIIMKLIRYNLAQFIKYLNFGPIHI